MENQVSPSKIGVRYGVIAAIVFIIYGLILQLTGLAANQALGYVNLVFMIILFVLAHNAFKAANEGYMAYGQGVTIGVIISLIGGTISSIFTFIYLKFVDDSMIKIAMDQAYDKMAQKGLSDEQIDQAMKMTEKFMTPTMMMIFGIIFTFIFGLIIALIISAITQKKKPEAAI